MSAFKNGGLPTIGRAGAGAVLGPGVSIPALIGDTAEGLRKANKSITNMEIKTKELIDQIIQGSN